MRLQRFGYQQSFLWHNSGVATISLPDTASHHEMIPAIVRSIVRLLQATFVSSWLFYPLFYLLRHPRIIHR